MLTASMIGTALAIATVLGASTTAYLWLVRRQRLLVSNGITSLAAMRWREFAHFVVDALRAQGFEHDASAPRPQKGQQADLMLSRDNQTWLLGCKQGPGEVIMAPQVAALSRSVRETGAGGGILATLGKIDPAARQGSPGIELLDGQMLWSLLQPLLPQSLQMDLAQRAHARTVRHIQLAWVGALIVGVLVAMQLPSVSDSDAVPVAVGPASVAADATPASNAAGTGTDLVTPAPMALPAPLPGSEESRRDQAMRDISQLPGIEEALWATRSTLVVYLSDGEASQQEVASLCATLERFDELRASRLQLQPIPESGNPVRFMQCHAY